VIGKPGPEFFADQNAENISTLIAELAVVILMPLNGLSFTGAK